MFQNMHPEPAPRGLRTVAKAPYEASSARPQATTVFTLNGRCGASRRTRPCGFSGRTRQECSRPALPSAADVPFSGGSPGRSSSGEAVLGGSRRSKAREAVASTTTQTHLIRQLSRRRRGRRGGSGGLRSSAQLDGIMPRFVPPYLP